MLKNIVKTNKVELMGFDGVMKEYSNLVYKLAHKYTDGHDFEDLMQEGYVALWEAFLSYDEVHCFSTHATWQLRKRYTQLLVAKKAKIRNDENLEIIRFDKKAEDNNNDYYNSVVDKQSDFEESLLTKLAIESVMHLLSDEEKKLMGVLMGLVNGAELARRENVSRQNISQQAKKLKRRLKILLKDVNF